MKYSLLNNLDDPALSGAERRAGYFEWTELARRRISMDVHATMKELPPPTITISSISARNGKRLVTDGPFAETRELLGG